MNGNIAFRLIPLLAVALAACDAPARQADTTVSLTTRPDLVRHFSPYDSAAFALRLPARDLTITVGGARVVERRVPASTFKIPHALVALDAGVVGVDEVMSRDPDRYPAEAWWPETWREDHTLASAVEHSVVWFFREIAGRVGAEREQAYLDRLGYGNRAIGERPTSFWLDGPLEISALEQVDFLERLWTGELDASAEAIRQTRTLVPVLDRTPRRTVRGKTGTGRIGERRLNWLVGVIEQGEEIGFFALWIEADAWLPLEARLAVVDGIMGDLRSDGE